MTRDELLDTRTQLTNGRFITYRDLFAREGFTLAPLEPTEVMVKAGQKPPPRSPKYTKLTAHNVEIRWRAMLAAVEEG